MLTSAIITSQHWYYNEAVFKQISKKMTEKKEDFFMKRKQVLSK